MGGCLFPFSPYSNRMSKKGLFTFLVILLLIGGTGYFYYNKQADGSSEKATAQVSKPNAQQFAVEVFPVHPQPLREIIRTTGSLIASESISVRSETSGKVVSFNFMDGQEVEEGQLLFKIDDSELQAQRNRTLFRKELAKARAQRISQLLKQGGMSQEDFDNAENEMNVLRAELQLIDAQLAKKEIRAPFSGRVGLRYVSLGSLVLPDTELTTLHKLDPIKIDFPVAERFASLLRPGMKIQFRVIGETNPFTGEIYALNPRIDSSTRNLQVRALTPNSENRLIPGSFANVEIVLDEIPNALLIPAIALIPGLNEQRVFIVNDNKQVESRIVETGQRLASQVQIINGLEPGDLVLTTGLLQAKEGIAVKILNEDILTANR